MVGGLENKGEGLNCILHSLFILGELGDRCRMAQHSLGVFFFLHFLHFFSLLSLIFEGLGVGLDVEMIRYPFFGYSFFLWED